MTTRIKKDVVVIYPGPVPAANVLAANEIEERFPEYRVTRIDLKKYLRSNYGDLLRAISSSYLEYGPEILLKRRRIGATVCRTSIISSIARKAIREKNIDNLVFTFQMQSLFDSSIPNVPHFLYTDHTGKANMHYPIVDKHKLEKRGFLERERNTYKNALSFCWSENIRRSVIQDYGIPPDRVITALAAPNVQLNRFPASVHPEVRRNTILFVGIDWQRKGGPDLLEAFKRSAADRPGARLRIVGCDPVVDHPQIEVVGRVPIEKVVQEFANAATFCLPTYVEPFGIAFLDAMSQEAAVIGTNLGAIPEIIEDRKTGLLVEPGNRERLSDALSWMLDNPENAEAMGKLGRKRLMSAFTWGAVGDRLEAGIRAELDRSRKSGLSVT